MRLAANFVWLATAVYITVNGSIGVNDFTWIAWLSILASLVCTLIAWTLDAG